MTATRGPCSTWDPIWCCPLTSESPMTTGVAAQIATEILYNLSGQIFDQCEFTIRPCRRECNDGAWWGGLGGWGASWAWGGWNFWPMPALIGGNWFNLTCGGCAGSCSCTELSEALLPSPVASITQVKLDGVVLVNGTDYRVDDFRKLVRLGGESWPVCQDMTLADTEDNTWSVTLVVGEAVPMLGRLAVAELACELRAFCNGDECAIPFSARSISRQGITIDLPTVEEQLRRGLLGLRWCDQFVATYNPRRLMAVPLVFDVDGENFRRAGT